MKRSFYNEPGHTHFLTFSCYHKRQLLTSERARTWLAAAIGSARQKHDFYLWAYVFMPDHVHLLLHPRQTSYSIPEILRDIKQPVSRRTLRTFRKESPWELAKLESRQGRRTVYRFWQAGGGYDRNVTSLEVIEKAINYIEWNPVRSAYVSKPEDWAWSSVRARQGWTGVPLPIDEISF